MQAIVMFFWGCAAPFGPYTEPFDDDALPALHIDDLLRFYDPLMTVRRDESVRGIGPYVRELESRWWDMAGRQHEYSLAVIHLRWTRDCWLALRDVAIGSGMEEWRMQRLRDLRRLLGPSAYYDGIMPALPDDLARFAELPMPRTVE